MGPTGFTGPRGDPASGGNSAFQLLPAFSIPRMDVQMVIGGDGPTFWSSATTRGFTAYISFQLRPNTALTGSKNRIMDFPYGSDNLALYVTQNSTDDNSNGIFIGVPSIEQKIPNSHLLLHGHAYTMKLTLNFRSWTSAPYALSYVLEMSGEVLSGTLTFANAEQPEAWKVNNLKLRPAAFFFFVVIERVVTTTALSTGKYVLPYDQNTILSLSDLLSTFNASDPDIFGIVTLSRAPSGLYEFFNHAAARTGFMTGGTWAQSSALTSGTGRWRTPYFRAVM
jgi:hypothetical protein